MDENFYQLGTVDSKGMNKRRDADHFVVTQPQRNQSVARRRKSWKNQYRLI